MVVQCAQDKVSQVISQIERYNEKIGSNSGDTSYVIMYDKQNTFKHNRHLKNVFITLEFNNKKSEQRE